jgi:hypothetical protein
LVLTALSMNSLMSAISSMPFVIRGQGPDFAFP